MVDGKSMAYVGGLKIIFIERSFGNHFLKGLSDSLTIYIHK